MPEIALPDVATNQSDPTLVVVRALTALRARRPAAAALIVLHHLDQRSLRDLSKELRCDRRTLARRLLDAESELGRILEDLP